MKVDLVPRQPLAVNESIEFNDGIESITISPNELHVMRDIKTLYDIATKQGPCIIVSHLILQISIIRNTHKCSLKIAKDAFTYIRENHLL
jgi:hypothetical protein